MAKKKDCPCPCPPCDKATEDATLAPYEPGPQHVEEGAPTPQTLPRRPRRPSQELVTEAEDAPSIPPAFEAETREHELFLLPGSFELPGDLVLGEGFRRWNEPRKYGGGYGAAGTPQGPALLAPTADRGAKGFSDASKKGGVGDPHFKRTKLSEQQRKRLETEGKIAPAPELKKAALQPGGKAAVAAAQAGKKRFGAGDTGRTQHAAQDASKKTQEMAAKAGLVSEFGSGPGGGNVLPGQGSPHPLQQPIDIGSQKGAEAAFGAAKTTRQRFEPSQKTQGQEKKQLEQRQKAIEGKLGKTSAPKTPHEARAGGSPSGIEAGGASGGEGASPELRSNPYWRARQRDEAPAWSPTTPSPDEVRRREQIDDEPESRLSPHAEAAARRRREELEPKDEPAPALPAAARRRREQLENAGQPSTPSPQSAEELRRRRDAGRRAADAPVARVASDTSLSVTAGSGAGAPRPHALTAQAPAPPPPSLLTAAASNAVAGTSMRVTAQGARPLARQPTSPRPGSGMPADPSAPLRIATTAQRNRRQLLDLLERASPGLFGGAPTAMSPTGRRLAPTVELDRRPAPEPATALALSGASAGWAVTASVGGLGPAAASSEPSTLAPRQSPQVVSPTLSAEDYETEAFVVDPFDAALERLDSFSRPGKGKDLPFGSQALVNALARRDLWERLKRRVGELNAVESGVVEEELAEADRLVAEAALTQVLQLRDERRWMEQNGYSPEEARRRVERERAQIVREASLSLYLKLREAWRDGGKQGPPPTREEAEAAILEALARREPSDPPPPPRGQPAGAGARRDDCPCPCPCPDAEKKDEGKTSDEPEEDGEDGDEEPGERGKRSDLTGPDLASGGHTYAGGLEGGPPTAPSATVFASIVSDQLQKVRHRIETVARVLAKADAKGRRGPDAEEAEAEAEALLDEEQALEMLVELEEALGLDLPQSFMDRLRADPAFQALVKLRARLAAIVSALGLMLSDPRQTSGLIALSLQRRLDGALFEMRLLSHELLGVAGSVAQDIEQENASWRYRSPWSQSSRRIARSLGEQPPPVSDDWLAAVGERVGDLRKTGGAQLLIQLHLADQGNRGGRMSGPKPAGLIGGEGSWIDVALSYPRLAGDIARLLRDHGKTLPNLLYERPYGIRTREDHRKLESWKLWERDFARKLLGRPDLPAASVGAALAEGVFDALRAPLRFASHRWRHDEIMPQLRSELGARFGGPGAVGPLHPGYQRLLDWAKAQDAVLHAAGLPEHGLSSRHGREWEDLVRGGNMNRWPDALLIAAHRELFGEGVASYGQRHREMKRDAAFTMGVEIASWAVGGPLARGLAAGGRRLTGWFGRGVGKVGRVRVHGGGRGGGGLGIGGATEMPGGGWTRLPRTGTRIRKVDDYFVKEVDPDASSFMQWYGGGTLRAQARGLGKLGDMAPEFAFDGTRLTTRDVGKFQGTVFSTGYWKTRWQASKRLGPIDFFHDVQPRNMGEGGLIFDPTLHPLDQTAAWVFSIGAGTWIGVRVAEWVNDDE